MIIFRGHRLGVVSKALPVPDAVLFMFTSNHRNRRYEELFSPRKMLACKDETGDIQEEAKAALLQWQASELQLSLRP